MTEPPPNPLADDPPLVTRAEVDRLHAIRRAAPWYRERLVVDRAGPEGDAAFLLGLVDRLLSKALLPGEDAYRPKHPGDRYDVRSGPSLYMCGHGSWYVRAAGRPGVLLSLTGGVLDASRLRDLLNGRDAPATGDAAR